MQAVGDENWMLDSCLQNVTKRTALLSVFMDISDDNVFKTNCIK